MRDFEQLPRLAQGLPLRFRHLAGELRRASGHPNADREFERLLFRVSQALRDAYDVRLLPDVLLYSGDHDESGAYMFWEMQLAFKIVDYWSPREFIEPYEEYADGTRHGGRRAIVLDPGPISLVWPGVFDCILCHEGWLGDDVDMQSVFKTALVEQRFAIMGYYATACELLAEWIENHADDDHGKADHDDRDAIGSAALNAVVANGLAGVLQAAAGTRAVDQATAIIRKRVAADRRLYWRTADHWAGELRVTKKTITDSDGWREIMQWREANRADRVSKRVSKKTGK